MRTEAERGYFYYEYLLILSPSSEIGKTITRFKKYVEEEYGCKLAAQLIPHMTLANFIQTSENEEAIIRGFRNQASVVSPIHVGLKGFGKFNSHTVYVNVATPKPIMDLVSNLKVKFADKLKLVDSLKPYFINKLHITIARGMSPQQCEEVWAAYEKEAFNATFYATEMLLLRRPVVLSNTGYFESAGRYQKVAELPFEGKNSLGTQLPLFC
ncbi:2'-5' RNA ligase family protein [Mucilaginibacter sp. PAMB04274]|uniref:2'-5' RNA ligase family protein n=1 Tax=Mucilaginibacter sp. PAMB04274 TaxID=3138568 RepID=UPI0031F70A23